MPERTPLKEQVSKSGGNRPSIVDRWKALQESTVKGGLSWSDAGPEDLRDAIAAVTQDGAAVLLSKTSDGGALVIRIIDNNVSTPFYPASSSALNEVLGAIVDAARNA